MATLDYALLAEYARVDPLGLLTVVGASFDRIAAQSPGAAQQVHVAIRVLLDEDESDVEFDIKVEPPGQSFTLGFRGSAVRPDGAVSVDGKVAVVVAVGVAIPLPDVGVYKVIVTLSDEVAKTLRFVVEHPDPVSRRL